MVEAVPSSRHVTADENYTALREVSIAESCTVQDLTLTRDLGALKFESGVFSLGAPVLGRPTVAVFRGEGSFELVPPPGIESDYLNFLTRKEKVHESFRKLVLWFSDDTQAEVARHCQATPLDEQAEPILRSLRERLRRRTKRPRSLLEGLLHSDDVENIEAEILFDLYHPEFGGAFNAFIFGQEHEDLRFFVRPRGALRQVLGKDEVALICLDPGGREEGVWYLGRLGGNSRQFPQEVIDVDLYRLESRIEGEELSVRSEITFRALAAGDRVLSFGLLPTLRVSRVALDDGQILDYIQEPRDADSAFYVLLPEALEEGKTYRLEVDYEGEDVIDKAGGGNYSVGARTSWYPSVGAFSDRALFDLYFDFPKRLKLVSVGQRVSETGERGRKRSHWQTQVPVSVAGFNLGQLKEKTAVDSVTGMQVEGFAATQLPGYLRGAEQIGGMSPARLLENGIVDTQNSLRLFTHWFGKLPYSRLAITQQPEFNFGQSWPSLIYLPIVAFFDSTQRWRLLGDLDSDLTAFVREVTPHEVAHQWWGHLVGWSSYRDQWISEGFAEFSASLFVETTRPASQYLKFWQDNRDAILERNRFGHRATEVGPLSLGFRLAIFEAPGAYHRLVYAKGGYVLQMLRRIMYNQQDGDERFQSMLQEFVSQQSGRNAGTADFKLVVEKHMTPTMDLDQNGRMDWFFDQWVHGTEVPSYALDYSLELQPDGQVILKATATQSGVTPGFKMIVPLYLDFGQGPLRLGEVILRGSGSTAPFSVRLPRLPKKVMLNALEDVLAFRVENREQ